jgi:tubulin epsilon
VFPSPDDDVVTSPYNTALSLHQLSEHADCVLPVENSSLLSIVNRAMELLPPASSTASSARGRSTAFDSMNELAAQMLTGLTAGMRFSGPLNVDLNEITTNMVPFNGLHFVVPSLSPATTMAAAGIRRTQRGGKHAASRAGRLLPGEPRSTDAMFADAMHP